LALSYTLKLSIENCGQTAADRHGYYWKPIRSCHCPIWWYHCWPLWLTV